MGESRTFTGVTPAIWEHLQTLGRQQHGTVYEQDDVCAGRATTRTMVGRIVLGYRLDPAQNAITYTIEAKPFLVTTSQIWEGIEDAIRACKTET